MWQTKSPKRIHIYWSEANFRPNYINFRMVFLQDIRFSFSHSRTCLHILCTQPIVAAKFLRQYSYKSSLMRIKIALVVALPACQSPCEYFLSHAKIQRRFVPSNCIMWYCRSADEWRNSCYRTMCGVMSRWLWLWSKYGVRNAGQRIKYGFSFSKQVERIKCCQLKTIKKKQQTNRSRIAFGQLIERALSI